MILAAQQKGQPITRSDALNIMHIVYCQSGREPGIDLGVLQAAIEEYRDFDICDYAEGGGRAGQADQVLGAFRVYLRGDIRKTDCDHRRLWDFIAAGNCRPPLACAEDLACRHPGRIVTLASLDYAGPEIPQLILSCNGLEEHHLREWERAGGQPDGVRRDWQAYSACLAGLAGAIQAQAKTVCRR